MLNDIEGNVMNERKITMVAISYLSQVAEAILLQLLQQRPEAINAMEAGIRCSRYAQVIAQSDIEGVGLERRMNGIADAMGWLLVIRRQYGALLDAANRSMPSPSDIDKVADEATRESASYAGCI